MTRAGSDSSKWSVLAPTNARRAALSSTCFGVIARPRVLTLSSAIWCSAARAPSWRGLNGLHTSSHECYADDENDENAKRDQFSCNHTHLPDADLRRDNPKGVASLTRGHQIRRVVEREILAAALEARFGMRSAALARWHAQRLRPHRTRGVRRGRCRVRGCQRRPLFD